MDKLSAAREVISKTDKEIARLFEKRMEAVKEVAEYKKEKGLPIYDREREEALVAENLSNIKNEEIKEFYLSFIRSVTDISKEYQKIVIGEK